MRTHFFALTILLALAKTAGAAELQLDNKAPLFVHADPGSPRERVFLIFQGGGAALEPRLQGASGILNHILGEGPARLSATEYKKQLFLLNSEVSYMTTPRSTIVSIAAAPEKLQETLDLVSETIRTPKLDAANFAKAQEKTATAVAQREDSMGSTLRYFALRDAFAYHPDIMTGATSTVALHNVSLGVVKSRLPVLFNPEYLMVGATGPMAEAPLQTALNTLLKNSQWTKAYKPYAFRSAVFKPGAAETGHITILNKPKAADNQIFMLTRKNLPRDNADMIAFDLANDALGDGLSGSLARTLREERGLTYYAGSTQDVDHGYWAVMSFASTDKVEPLMKGLDEVVRGQSQLKIDNARAELLKKQQLRAFKEGRELPMDQLAIEADARLYGRDVAFANRLDQEIPKVTVEAINKSAQENFSMRDTKIYLMGDKDKLLSIVKKLGYKPGKIRIVELKDVL